jgi:hypothetical protein
MSGVRRNILAEIMHDGKSSKEEIMKAFSPEAQRAEKGRTIMSPVAKNADKGSYIGKNAKDATPGKKK